MDPVDVGKHFQADFVIDLEIGNLSLYEPGSANQLYRGQVDEINVRVVDVEKPEEGPIYEEAYSCSYPKTRGPVPVTDGNARGFRQAFLSHIAKELSWRFTAHPTDDDYSCD
jgi:hypothetical protein